MTTTTSYGTWTNHIEPFAASFEGAVADSLGDFGSDYDVDALAREYKAAINRVLPDSIELHGSEFIGPAYSHDQDWTGYPVDEHGNIDLKAIVESVDFWEIAARHDKTA